MLLALWGPTLATVGNLLTIVLVSIRHSVQSQMFNIIFTQVLLSDTLFGHALQTLTLSSLIGAGAIVTAFGVLVFEERRAQRRARDSSATIHSRGRPGNSVLSPAGAGENVNGVGIGTGRTRKVSWRAGGGRARGLSASSLLGPLSSGAAGSNGAVPVAGS